MNDSRPKFAAWLFYCLLAIVLWGVWGVVGRAAQQRMSEPTAQVISTIGVVPVALLLLASPNLRRGKRYRVGGLAAFGTGLCGSIGNVAFLLSFKYGGEASTVAPLTAMFPLVTVLLAVPLLGERINWIQGTGIVISVVALVLFNQQAEAAVRATHWWQKIVTPWMACALIAVVLWGIAAVLQKIATNHISTELSTVLFALAFVPVACVIAVIWPVQWRNLAATGWTLAVLWGALISVGTLILFAAYRTGKASIVTALYALYPAVTVLLAVPIFHEKIGLWKGVAIVLALAAGVALTFETPVRPAEGIEVVTPAGEEAGVR
jgi:bacterial/archaeal transporter family protein